MVIIEAVKKGIEKLSGVQNSVLDVHLLLCESIGIDRLTLLTQGNRELTAKQLMVFDHMLERRISGEPTQYILGRCEFMSLEFKVNSNVLIPRPDTETLVETALENMDGGRVLDIGTGSGCVAVSVAYYNKNVAVDALDISPDALDIAGENARINGVIDRMRFIEKDIFAGLQGEYDVILSNPPYIESSGIQGLQPEVLKEPVIALDGGEDGLDYYRYIVKLSKSILKPGGFLGFEVGHTQSGVVADMMRDAGFKKVDTAKDIAEIERVVYGVK